MEDKLILELSKEEQRYLYELLYIQENFVCEGAWELSDRLKKILEGVYYGTNTNR